MTATINAQRNSQTRIVSSTAAIGSSSSYAQSPAIRAKVISLTSARSTVVLGRVVYRHDQRKISDATVRTLAHVAPCPAGRPLSERKCGHSLASSSAWAELFARDNCEPRSQIAVVSK